MRFFTALCVAAAALCSTAHAQTVVDVVQDSGQIPTHEFTVPVPVSYTHLTLPTITE